MGTGREERTDDGRREAPAAAAVPADTLSLLAAVLSNAPFGFALLDNDLRYVHVNDVIAALNDVPAEDHVGRRPVDISTDLDDLVGPLLRQVRDTGEPIVGLAVRAHAPGDGLIHDWLFNAYPVPAPDGGRLGLAIAVVDVTEQGESMTRLEAVARQQAAVVELGMAALRSVPAETLIASALAAVRELVGMERAAVLRSDGRRLVLEACDPPDPTMVESVVVTPGDRTLAGETFAKGEPIVTDDRADETRYAQVAAAGDLEVKSALSVLIPGRRAPFGVLAVYGASPRTTTQDEIRFVQAVANIVGTAVERREAERALRRSDRRLRMAQEAGRLGAWEWDVTTGEIVWSEALEHLYGLPAGGFDGSLETFRSRVHPDDLDHVDAAVDRALESGSYEIEHRIVRADTGEVRWVFARGELVTDVDGTPRRLVGINIDTTERRSAEEERAQLLVAERAARAAAERASERLTFLSEATAVLSESLDYEDSLGGVAQLAVPTFADLCVIDLADGPSMSTVAVAHADSVDPDLFHELRRRYPPATIPDHPMMRVLTGGSPLVLTKISDDMRRELAADADHLDLMERLGIRSSLVAPLLARGRVLGTISLARTGDRTPFDAVDDVTLITELARRVALAIDNARLFGEVSRTSERFRRMAETLQESLLPPELPTIHGVDVAAEYRAAATGTSVGGDFYDVFALGDRGWGVVIGDVQGKGPEAATVTGIARHTIRTAAIRRDPVGSLHVLNEALLARAEPDPRFCTVLYGMLEPDEDALHLELASGGHPPALLRHAGGDVEKVSGGGTLMGVLDEVVLRTQRVRLDPGDCIVLYTDGVTEARGPHGDFGDDRLVELVEQADATTAAGVAADIVAAVAEFTGDRLRDDIALLVLRSTGDG